MTMATPRVTETLTDHTLTFPSASIPKEARDAGKMLLLDFLAVAIGGRQFSDSTATVLSGTHDLLCGAEGNCTVAGEATGYPAHFAALLNGTFAHSMDFDDTHVESVIHIGSPLFSTLLAIGEREGVSGRAFLDAAIMGYDFVAKAGNAHGASVHKRGFHPTPTTGIFGAVAAGARLMGLDRGQTLNALGMALNQAAGTMAFLEGGAWSKRIQVGLAAHNAIYALTYAKRGFLGPDRALEGRLGYYELYTEGGYDANRALEGLGDVFEVTHTGVKPYPSCRYNHSLIDGVLALVRTGRVRAEDIQSMELTISAPGYAIVGEPPEERQRPTSVVDGQFSAYFAASVTARDSKFGWAAYDRLQDADVVDLMGRTSVQIDDTLPRFGGRVSVLTKSGETVVEETLSPLGEPENPVNWAGLEAKFRDLAEGVVGSDGASRIIEAAHGIDDLNSVSDLTRLLRP
ncbi:MAG: 2-methylcitrate dehydratase PrpD [Chloroflexi bacterium]|nr:MAG: 2-methylcitrate dehydratase PrpD [Chloroflexota bacterium]